MGRQCFINEYVFDLTADENDRAQKLRDRISRALDVHGAISSMEIALLSSYMQLDCLPAAALLKRSWPSSITSLLEEQIQGPAAERKLRAAIPQLTPIANDTSVRVREQYEENPFPRWVKLSPNRQMPVDEWMPRQFPFSNFRKIAKGADLDVLIAGCGTGHHSIIFAQVLPEARILAVDLSLSSLCYAKEKTRTMGIKNIEYAQADILELGGLDRQFDVISSVACCTIPPIWREDGARFCGCSSRTVACKLAFTASVHTATSLSLSAGLRSVASRLRSRASDRRDKN